MSKRNKTTTNNVLNDSSTMSKLYMQSVNQTPHLHPGISLNSTQEEIACDFLSWCDGLQTGVQQYSMAGQTGTLRFPQPQQHQTGININTNSLPGPVRAALQEVVQSYGGSFSSGRTTGTGKQPQQQIFRQTA